MKAIIKFLKVLVDFEPLIIWLRYFKTIKIYNIFINFVCPAIICIVFGCKKDKELELLNIDIFTISSILVGFCSSILIMLFTLDDKNLEKLKGIKLNNKYNVSLHKALIYKYSFIVMNLLFLMFTEVVAMYFNFKDSSIYIVYILFVLLNTIFTLVEALTNVSFCLLSKKE